MVIRLWRKYSKNKYEIIEEGIEKIKEQSFISIIS